MGREQRGMLAARSPAGTPRHVVAVGAVARFAAQMVPTSTPVLRHMRFRRRGEARVEAPEIAPTAVAAVGVL